MCPRMLAAWASKSNEGLSRVLKVVRMIKQYDDTIGPEFIKEWASKPGNKISGQEVRDVLAKASEDTEKSGIIDLWLENNAGKASLTIYLEFIGDIQE